MDLVTVDFKASIGGSASGDLVAVVLDGLQLRRHELLERRRRRGTVGAAQVWTSLGGGCELSLRRQSHGEDMADRDAGRFVICRLSLRLVSLADLSTNLLLGYHVADHCVDPATTADGSLQLWARGTFGHGQEELVKRASLRPFQQRQVYRR